MTERRRKIKLPEEILIMEYERRKRQLPADLTSRQYEIAVAKIVRELGI